MYSFAFSSSWPSFGQHLPVPQARRGESINDLHSNLHSRAALYNLHSNFHWQTLLYNLQSKLSGAGNSCPLTVALVGQMRRRSDQILAGLENASPYLQDDILHTTLQGYNSLSIYCNINSSDMKYIQSTQLHFK